MTPSFQQCVSSSPLYTLGPTQNPQQMSSTATSIRSTHCHNIKWSVLQYLIPSDSTELNVPIALNLQKEDRGLKDKGTARFLIPRSWLDEFEKCPDR